MIINYTEFKRKIELNYLLGKDNDPFIQFLVDMKNNGVFVQDNDRPTSDVFKFCYKGRKLVSFFYDSSETLSFLSYHVFFNKINSKFNKVYDNEDGLTVIQSYAFDEFIMDYLNHYLIGSKQNVENKLIDISVK